DVKDDYAKEVLGILDNLKNVMINSVTVKDDLSKKLNTISAYKTLDSDKQKESYKEIQIIEDSLNQAELIKSGKLKTYPIQELWDMLDD
ncbi:MAG: hypothetical protein U9P72_02790, partial [Campylobacterota bacterium]|nr:hypothetical protein [Campylobacterota bacterium]